jgi:hypothetical protein
MLKPLVMALPLGGRPSFAGSRDTAFRWPHRFLTTAKDVKAKTVKGIVEADQTFIRRSIAREDGMNGKGSQTLVVQLGELLAGQREALIMALKRGLPVDKAVQLIDALFRTDPCCGHCRSKNATSTPTSAQ